jgi:hypothetical protein
MSIAGIVVDNQNSRLFYQQKTENPDNQKFAFCNGGISNTKKINHQYTLFESFKPQKPQKTQLMDSVSL